MGTKVYIENVLVKQPNIGDNAEVSPSSNGFDGFNSFVDVSFQKTLACIINGTPCPRAPKIEIINKKDGIERIQTIFKDIQREPGRSYFVYDPTTELIAHESGIVGTLKTYPLENELSKYLKIVKEKADGYIIFSLPEKEVEEADYISVPVIANTADETGLLISFKSFGIDVLTMPDVAQKVQKGELARFFLVDLIDMIMCVPVKGQASNRLIEETWGKNLAGLQSLKYRQGLKKVRLTVRGRALALFNAGSRLSRYYTGWLKESSAFIKQNGKKLIPAVKNYFKGQMEAATCLGIIAGGQDGNVKNSNGKHPLQLSNEPLDIYHVTTNIKGKRIMKDGFFARHLTEDGKAAEYFFPKSYAGKKFYQTKNSKVTIPNGGSGIYFGFAEDNTWKGSEMLSFFWVPNNAVEIRLKIPSGSGLKIVDLRSPENVEYVKQWARDKHVGLPLSEKDVDIFVAEHKIDVLIRKGRTGRDTFKEVILKSERAYDYVNGLPKEMKKLE